MKTYLNKKRNVYSFSFVVLQVSSFTHAKNVRCQVMFTEGCLEPSRISVIQFFRNSHRCSVEKTVLKYFAIFTGNTSVGVSFQQSCRPSSHIRTEYESLSVYIQFKCGEKIEKKKKCGYFRSLWLWLLTAIMKKCAERCALQLYCTSSIYIYIQNKK